MGHKACIHSPKDKCSYLLFTQHYKIVNTAKFQKMLEQSIENVKAGNIDKLVEIKLFKEIECIY